MKSETNIADEEAVNIEAIKNHRHSPTGKADNIIRMFEKGMDGREIAKILRFKDMKELGSFMRNAGYKWNDDLENYTLKPQVVHLKTVPMETTEQASESGLNDVLKLLTNNKDKLNELLTEDDTVQMVPRYMLSGVLIAKTISIADSLNDLAKDYCQERNMTQRSMFEVAIIDFLKSMATETK